MYPEIKIILYLIFAISLFIIDNFTFLLISGVLGLCMLILYHDKRIRSGAIPISILLLGTFFGNIFFEQGKIILNFWGVEITEEGLKVGVIRSIRVFLIIIGVKILNITSKTDDLIDAFGNLLKPLKIIKLPVKEFIELMKLTIETLPKLKIAIKNNYKEYKINNNVSGFSGKIRLLTDLLIPIIISTINSPEKFFKKLDKEEG